MNQLLTIFWICWSYLEKILNNKAVIIPKNDSQSTLIRSTEFNIKELREHQDTFGIFFKVNLKAFSKKSLKFQATLIHNIIFFFL